MASICAALLTACLYTALISWLSSISEVRLYSAAQLGVAVFYGVVLAAWAGAEAGFYLGSKLTPYSALADEEDAGMSELGASVGSGAGSRTASGTVDSGGDDSGSVVSGVECPLVSDVKSEPLELSAQPTLFGLKHSHLNVLRAMGEFTLIMGYVYLCDRTTCIPKGAKVHSRLNFWGLNGVILLIALCTLRAAPQRGPVETAAKPLQRDQTEEWKGWMQLMFILYHYFVATEIYNAIRIYIAAYVWMTGFGNFSYYYIKRDFTLVRFVQMMWRLNFFVFFMCITMNNEYMLYYICPMHTFFTLTVFIPLFIGHRYNSSDLVCTMKIGISFLVAVLLYHVPAVFNAVFSPMMALLRFEDPLHPEFNSDPLHEWFFRSGLDHLVWVFGMLCALCYPWFERKLSEVEALPRERRLATKGAVVGCVLAVLFGWRLRYFSLGKRQYNAVHPYTSWIPILCYLILRNLSPLMRTYSMHLFSWCGKVTLETYILQFHIWMKTTGLNGSPKYLMVWVPDHYWINFALTSAVYFFVSYRVFKITVVLRDACIPNETADIVRRAGSIALGSAAFYAIGLALQSL